VPWRDIEFADPNAAANRLKIECWKAKVEWAAANARKLTILHYATARDLCRGMSTSKAFG
jgi:hypothetical protein